MHSQLKSTFEKHLVPQYQNTHSLMKKKALKRDKYDSLQEFIYLVFYPCRIMASPKKYGLSTISKWRYVAKENR